MPTLLSIRNLNAYYGKAIILQDVTFDVLADSRVAILGRNGMGKSTLMKAILGLSGIRREGSVTFESDDILNRKTHEIAAGGIAYVPQGWQLFSSLSVMEHLIIAYRRGKSGKEWTPQRVFEVFPELKDRRKISGTRLSGGEQQILSIARALVTNSKLVLMDEPSEGISTLVLERIIGICRGLTEQGVGLLLVEQNLDLALRVAQKVYVLVNGRIVVAKDVDETGTSREGYHQYLGI